MASVPLSEKAAQLLFPRIGSNMRPPVTVEDDTERIERLLADCPVGGLVLFNGDAHRTPENLARLQRQSSNPLLIATDMERGAGQQLRGATIFPHAYAFDALGNEAESAIEECAYAAAVEALASGVHISFSPVADVHSNPDNPIISIRCFGSDPDTVSARIRAYIRGCRRAGLLTTAKHFPGHGDTSTDSHEQVPLVSKSRTDLARQELVPFTAAIDEQVDLVMTAHVAYTSLDPSGTVATASHPILTQLLRKEMGFAGAVITDSLLMEAAVQNGQKDHGDVDFWAARLLLSGVDILLDIRDAKQTVNDLLRAVDTGFLPQERIEEAYDRVMALKMRFSNRFGPHVFQDPSIAACHAEVGSRAHQDLSHKTATTAVRILTGSKDSISLDQTKIDELGMLVLLVRPHVTYNDPTAGSLKDHLAEYFENVTFTEITPHTKAEDLQNLSHQAPGFAAVVVAAVVKPAAWHRFGLLPDQTAFIADLVERCPVILGALGSPRMLDDFPNAALGICTYSDVDVSQRAFVLTLADLAKGPIT